MRMGAWIGLFLLAGAALAAEPVKQWEDTLTLPTYGWEDDPNPVFQAYEGGIYYPWTKQDHLPPQKQDRAYRALHLENEYLHVVCLPELGGRIHSVFDKTTGEEMFHKNDVIKPALIAMRGAWIAGGIEWNVGPQGHTVFMMEPVGGVLEANPDGSATLIVAAVEKTFRTRWEVRLTLHPGRALLDEEIRLANPTDGVQPYYFWNNTAFPNRPGTRFIYPMTLGTDHNGTTFFTWPENGGRDITWLRNYDTMTSVFGYRVDFDFFGAYDADRDRGIVSHANHHQVPGKKAWTWGTDDFGVYSQMGLTDAGRDEAPYIEVQSGPLRTQADYGMMRPRQTIAWRECWYPVHGLGDGFDFANGDLAVSVKRDGAALAVRMIATAEHEAAECVLFDAQDTRLSVRMVTLSPKTPNTLTFDLGPDLPADAPLRLRVSVPGAVLLDQTFPLQIPKVDPPSLEKKPARADGLPTADELFAEAFLLDSQSKPDEARAAYGKALKTDPAHADTLWALAVLDNEQGLYASAASRAEKALERDPEHGPAAYQLGVACLRRGDFAAAATWGWKASRCAGLEAAGLNLAGRAAMNLGRLDEARSLFERAAAWAPQDRANRDSLLAVRSVLGGGETLAKDLAAVRRDAPLDPLPALLEPLARGEVHTLVPALRGLGGDPVFNVLDAAAFFADHGQPAAALILLRAVIKDRTLFPQDDPFVLYAAAYYRDRLGDDAPPPLKVVPVDDLLARAAAAPLSKNFPHGAQAFAVLEWAVTRRPDAANAPYLLGLACAGAHRLDEAVARWEAAVALDPGLAPAWRLLGLHRWKKDADLAGAEECLRKALAAAPADQVVLRDLTAVLTALQRRPEALALVEALPAGVDVRYDLALWRAGALLGEKQYDRCLDLLRTGDFTNWEGSTRPRDLYTAALTARGKLRAEEGRTDEALADFREALTYPENLGVGRKYKPTEAEARYWAGKMLHQLGRTDEARAEWTEGASQVDRQSPALPFITVTDAQDAHVKKCAAALELLGK
ncbi:MAG TPA: DUF5107 domain-containing protein [Candidatus Hydrogenedentes bacterium]|nr:DUF5107 domain-containing protein [Candidatus Hydrogenedentota bacterium]